jgi:hypothetical protein
MRRLIGRQMMLKMILARIAGAQMLVRSEQLGFRCMQRIHAAKTLVRRQHQPQILAAQFLYPILRPKDELKGKGLIKLSKMGRIV